MISGNFLKTQCKALTEGKTRERNEAIKFLKDLLLNDETCSLDLDPQSWRVLFRAMIKLSEKERLELSQIVRAGPLDLKLKKKLQEISQDLRKFVEVATHQSSSQELKLIDELPLSLVLLELLNYLADTCSSTFFLHDPMNIDHLKTLHAILTVDIYRDNIHADLFSILLDNLPGFISVNQTLGLETVKVFSELLTVNHGVTSSQYSSVLHACLLAATEFSTNNQSLFWLMPAFIFFLVRHSISYPGIVKTFLPKSIKTFLDIFSTANANIKQVSLQFLHFYMMVEENPQIDYEWIIMKTLEFIEVFHVDLSPTVFLNEYHRPGIHFTSKAFLVYKILTQLLSRYIETSSALTISTSQPASSHNKRIRLSTFISKIEDHLKGKSSKKAISILQWFSVFLINGNDFGIYSNDISHFLALGCSYSTDILQEWYFFSSGLFIDRNNTQIDLLSLYHICVSNIGKHESSSSIFLLEQLLKTEKLPLSVQKDFVRDVISKAKTDSIAITCSLLKCMHFALLNCRLELNNRIKIDLVSKALSALTTNINVFYWNSIFMFLSGKIYNQNNQCTTSFERFLDKNRNRIDVVFNRKFTFSSSSNEYVLKVDCEPELLSLLDSLDKNDFLSPHFCHELSYVLRGDGRTLSQLSKWSLKWLTNILVETIKKGSFDTAITAIMDSFEFIMLQDAAELLTSRFYFTNAELQILVPFLDVLLSLVLYSFKNPEMQLTTFSKDCFDGFYGVRGSKISLFQEMSLKIMANTIISRGEYLSDGIWEKLKEFLVDVLFTYTVDENLFEVGTAFASYLFKHNSDSFSDFVDSFLPQIDFSLPPVRKIASFLDLLISLVKSSAVLTDSTGAKLKRIVKELISKLSETSLSHVRIRVLCLDYLLDCRDSIMHKICTDFDRLTSLNAIEQLDLDAKTVRKVCRLFYPWNIYMCLILWNQSFDNISLTCDCFMYSLQKDDLTLLENVVKQISTKLDHSYEMIISNIATTALILHLEETEKLEEPSQYSFIKTVFRIDTLEHLAERIVAASITKFYDKKDAKNLALLVTLKPSLTLFAKYVMAFETCAVGRPPSQNIMRFFSVQDDEDLNILCKNHPFNTILYLLKIGLFMNKRPEELIKLMAVILKVSGIGPLNLYLSGSKLNDLISLLTLIGELSMFNDNFVRIFIVISELLVVGKTQDLKLEVAISLIKFILHQESIRKKLEFSLKRKIFTTIFKNIKEVSRLAMSVLPSIQAFETKEGVNNTERMFDSLYAVVSARLEKFPDEKLLLSVLVSSKNEKNGDMEMLDCWIRRLHQNPRNVSDSTIMTLTRSIGDRILKIEGFAGDNDVQTLKILLNKYVPSIMSHVVSMKDDNDSKGQIVRNLVPSFAYLNGTILKYMENMDKMSSEDFIIDLCSKYCTSSTSKIATTATLALADLLQNANRISIVVSNLLNPPDIQQKTLEEIRFEKDSFSCDTLIWILNVCDESNILRKIGSLASICKDFCKEILPVAFDLLLLENERKVRHFFDYVYSKSLYLFHDEISQQLIRIVSIFRLYNRKFTFSYHYFAQLALLTNQYPYALHMMELNQSALDESVSGNEDRSLFHDIISGLSALDPDAIYTKFDCDISRESLVEKLESERKYPKSMAIIYSQMVRKENQFEFGMKSFLRAGIPCNVVNANQVYGISEFSLKDQQTLSEILWRQGSWDLELFSLEAKETTDGCIFDSFKKLILNERNIVLPRQYSMLLTSFNMQSSNLIPLLMLYELEEYFGNEGGAHLTTFKRWKMRSELIQKTVPFESIEKLETFRNSFLFEIWKYSKDSEIQSFLISNLLRVGYLARKNDSAQISLTVQEKLTQITGKSCEIMFEYAKSLWKLEEFLPAIECVKHIVKTASQRNDYYSKCYEHALSHESFMARVFCKLGTWSGKVKSEKSDRVISYFEDALALLKDSRVAEFVAVKSRIHAKFAVYLDECYGNVASSNYFEAAIEMEKQQRKELEELRKIENQVRCVNERKSISKEILRLETQHKLDLAEKIRLESSKQNYLIQALNNYLASLELGGKYDHYVFRLVSLWHENKNDASVNQSISKDVLRVSSFKFLQVSYQLYSRISAGNELEYRKALETVIMMISIDHPYHTLYHFFSICLSDYNNRRKHDQEFALRQDSSSDLLRRVARKSKKHSTIVEQMNVLTNALNEFANYDLRKKDQHQLRVEMEMDHNLKLRKITDLDHVHVVTKFLEINRAGHYTQITPIRNFKPNYQLVGGINLPKKIFCIGADGHEYIQLLKGFDDLRQDAVLEQVFDSVNELMMKHFPTRQRKMQMKTYRVIPISTRTGILEWLSDTIPFGTWSAEAHKKYHPDDYKPEKCRELMKKEFERPISNPKTKLEKFKDIKAHFKPIMRYFFFERFIDSEEWYMKRLNYVRSVAVSSVLGWCLGLGDRHAQNILLDLKNANIIHIDLGMAFDQSKLLSIPEVVPFRLTQDLIDGMGISKTEGTFKRCMEEALKVMKTEKDVVMTILEVLKHDPLYNWTLSSLRAAKMNQNTVVKQIDQAERALLTVKKKLNNNLAVECQVIELINEAQDDENLCMMYHGWQAWM